MHILVNDTRAWVSKARGSSISGLTRSVNTKWDNNAQSILQILFSSLDLAAQKREYIRSSWFHLPVSLFGPLHYHVADTFQSALRFFNLSLCIFFKFHKQLIALQCIRNKLSLVTQHALYKIFCWPAV